MLRSKSLKSSLYSSAENCLLSQTVGSLVGLVRKSGGQTFNSACSDGLSLDGTCSLLNN
jgi:hypothetical protein